MESKPGTSSPPAPARESRVWRIVLNGFLKSAPTALMRTIRRRNPKAPIEEFVLVGRKTGRERRMLLGLFEVDGRWYAGHPNGTAQWIRNLEAEGGCTVIRRDGIPTRVIATEVTDPRERETVIQATWSQPAPAGLLYRRATPHIRAVGRYFRLTPVSDAGSAQADTTAP